MYEAHYVFIKVPSDVYANWSVKFFAHSRVKGFHDVMMGTEAVPATAKTGKTAEEKKLTEGYPERRNDISYSHLIMSVDGKAFPMVKNARTTELPAGSLSLCLLYTSDAADE